MKDLLIFGLIFGAGLLTGVYAMGFVLTRELVTAAGRASREPRDGNTEATA